MADKTDVLLALQAELGVLGDALDVQRCDAITSVAESVRPQFPALAQRIDDVLGKMQNLQDALYHATTQMNGILRGALS